MEVLLAVPVAPLHPVPPALPLFHTTFAASVFPPPPQDIPAPPDAGVEAHVDVVAGGALHDDALVEDVVAVVPGPNTVSRSARAAYLSPPPGVGAGGLLAGATLPFVTGTEPVLIG